MDHHALFKKNLIHRFWAYQEFNFQPWDKYFDRPNHEDSRPPVFIEKEAIKNVITNPDSKLKETNVLFDLIPSGEHHKWFCSMNSSQALALSILGNLFIHRYLSCLADLLDDDGFPLLGEESYSNDKFSMEHKIDYLGEPRQSSIDGFIFGDYQIAIECKLTESEVGSCSRPRLTESDSNFQRDHCDGSYTKQRNRKERCTLTENGVQYWGKIPQFFKWDKNIDMKICPLNRNYQLVRNILAAGVKPDGSASVTNGHAILIYDERNPSCQLNGNILNAFQETKCALVVSSMLRKISWQRIVLHMRKEKVLPWLSDELALKYGF